MPEDNGGKRPEAEAAPAALWFFHDPGAPLRLVTELPLLAQRAETVAGRCRRSAVCAPLVPTIDGYVLPAHKELTALFGQARERNDLFVVFVRAAQLGNLLTLLEVMVEQRA